MLSLRESALRVLKKHKHESLPPGFLDTLFPEGEYSFDSVEILTNYLEQSRPIRINKSASRLSWYRSQLGLDYRTSPVLLKGDLCDTIYARVYDIRISRNRKRKMPAEQWEVTIRFDDATISEFWLEIHLHIAVDISSCDGGLRNIICQSVSSHGKGRLTTFTQDSEFLELLPSTLDANLLILPCPQYIVCEVPVKIDDHHCLKSGCLSDKPVRYNPYGRIDRVVCTVSDSSQHVLTVSVEDSSCPTFCLVFDLDLALIK